LFLLRPKEGSCIFYYFAADGFISHSFIRWLKPTAKDSTIVIQSAN